MIPRACNSNGAKNFLVNEEYISFRAHIPCPPGGEHFNEHFSLLRSESNKFLPNRTNKQKHFLLDHTRKRSEHERNVRMLQRNRSVRRRSFHFSLKTSKYTEKFSRDGQRSFSSIKINFHWSFLNVPLGTSAFHRVATLCADQFLEIAEDVSEGREIQWIVLAILVFLIYCYVSIVNIVIPMKHV